MSATMQVDDNDPIVPAAGDGAPAGTENQSDESTETETEDGDGEEGSKTETSTEDGEGDENADGEDDGEEGDDDDDGEGEEPKPKKKSTRTERYRRQNERLKAQLAAAGSSPTRGGAQPDATAVEAEVERIIGKKPTLEDCKGDYIEHERALAAYNVDKRLTTREVTRDFGNKAKANADAFAELVEDHQERIADFKKKVPDFVDVVTKASKAGVEASGTVESLVLESDKSAHLLYYLAKNPSAVEKLNAMTERQAAREIGRIEAKLSLPQPNKQTKAPKPVAPVKGGGAGPASQMDALNGYLTKTYGKK